MKIRIFAIAAFFVLAVNFAVAQSEFPKAEIGTTYQYIRTSSTGFREQFNMNGGNGSLTYNFNKVFGFTGEFGAAYSGNIRGFNASAHMFSYLFGPKFSARGEKVTVFGNALFGGAWANGDFVGMIGPSGQPPTTSVQVTGSNNSMAMSIGGGLDINAGKRVAVRVAQLDYFMTRFNPANQSSTQNNLRYQAGLVFKF
jgi:hypothetical protein